MSSPRSAGLLMYRGLGVDLEVFLVHPGGPYFARRERGVWTIPKGEIEHGEVPFDVACREFHEETGRTIDACGGKTPMVALGEIRQAGGKIVAAWGFAGDWPEGLAIASNTFTLEWPARSGKFVSFPEVDRGGFFAIEQARTLMNPAQVAFLDRLVKHLGGSTSRKAKGPARALPDVEG